MTSPDEDRPGRLGRSVWTALLPLWGYALIVGVLAAGLGLVAALLTDVEPRLPVQLAVAAVVACPLGLAYPVVLERVRRVARRRL
jgi:hypothetical protein